MQEALKNNMPTYLGIDTSNYTTSCALFDASDFSVRQSKKLLPVKEGELGLRQSDAVFHHVRQIPEVLSGILPLNCDIQAAGVSARPRNVEGSYMPCFLVGESFAQSYAMLRGISVYKTSHQTGHILAALYSCRRLDLIKNKTPFIAFHVSGGTTDCLYVSYSDEDVIDVSEISSSLDLKAGQLIDRVGAMLGIRFPAGKELEALAEKSERVFRIKPSVKDGSCSLSGVENRCCNMLMSGQKPCDTALYALKYIEAAVFEMTKYALDKLGSMPVIYAGGVMSDKLIRKRLSESFDAYFAEPDFSCDNAVGTAIYAALKDGCFL